MKMKARINTIFAAVAAIGLTACSKPEPAPTPTGTDMSVTVRMSDYKSGGVAIAGETSWEGLKACLFKDGVMSAVYDNPVQNNDVYMFNIDKNAGTLYVLTAADDIVNLNSLLNEGISERDWLALTAGTKNGKPVRFAAGTVTLSGEKTASVNVSRGFARVDLKMETIGEAYVEDLTFVGANTSTPIFTDATTDNHGDITFIPETAYTTDTPGVAYLYAQDNNITVQAQATINGKSYTLETTMPQPVNRNSIYVLTLTKDSIDNDAHMSVEEWSPGSDTDLQPDWDEPIVIDIANSALPSDVTVSDNGTVITMPYTARDFTLAMQCNDELEIVSISGDRLAMEATVATDNGMNIFRIRKPLYAPGMPSETIKVQFRRKGLNETYPEDVLEVHMSANPTIMSGEMSFDADTYTCDFERYIDNELGRITTPEGKTISVEFGNGEDPWIKLSALEGDATTYRVVAGWKPNDPTANGRVQSATLVIANADGSDREEYTVSRRNYGLPVTWMHGVWWCKYNARGNSRSFEDQILSSNDPAAAAGKSVFNYLRDCSAEEFYDIWGWAYQGDSGIGMRVIDDNGKLVMDGFSASSSVHINKLPADALSPDGYELPSMEEFNRIFDATDYIWMMWNGTHTLRQPWEGHSQVKREQRRRNDITIGSVQTTDLLYISMWSPDFTEYEPITWYGPGAQWNTDGIMHSSHYNNILFGVYSPEGSGWYISGGMQNLYMTKNGAGTKDTRILRFKKSPVEYIYE